MAVPTIVAITSARGTATSLTKPAGGTSGDIYAFSLVEEDTGAGGPYSITDFTEYGRQGAVGKFTSAILTKSHTGSEGASFSLSGKSNWGYLFCALIRGAASAVPLFGTIGALSGSGPYSSVTAGGITIPGDDYLGFTQSTNWNGGRTHSATTNSVVWTQQAEDGFTASFIHTHELDAGATGGVVWSVSPSDSDVQATMYAFEPAAAAANAPYGGQRYHRRRSGILVPHMARRKR